MTRAGEWEVLMLAVQAGSEVTVRGLIDNGAPWSTAPSTRSLRSWSLRDQVTFRGQERTSSRAPNATRRKLPPPTMPGRAVTTNSPSCSLAIDSREPMGHEAAARSMRGPRAARSDGAPCLRQAVAPHHPIPLSPWQPGDLAPADTTIP